jgi:hypothetical protein
MINTEGRQGGQITMLETEQQEYQTSTIQLMNMGLVTDLMVGRPITCQAHIQERGEIRWLKTDFFLAIYDSLV